MMILIPSTPLTTESTPASTPDLTYGMLSPTSPTLDTPGPSSPTTPPLGQRRGWTTKIELPQKAPSLNTLMCTPPLAPQTTTPCTPPSPSLRDRRGVNMKLDLPTSPSGLAIDCILPSGAIAFHHAVPKVPVSTLRQRRGVTMKLNMPLEPSTLNAICPIPPLAFVPVVPTPSTTSSLAKRRGVDLKITLPPKGPTLNTIVACGSLAPNAVRSTPSTSLRQRRGVTMTLNKEDVPDRKLGYKIIDPRFPNPPCSFEKNFRWLSNPAKPNQVSSPRPHLPSAACKPHREFPQRGALGPEHGKLPRAKRTPPPHRRTSEPIPTTSEQAKLFYKTYTGGRKDCPKFSSVVVAVMAVVFMMFITMLYHMITTAFSPLTVGTVARQTRTTLERFRDTAGQSVDLLSRSLSSEKLKFPSR